jgi:hypothetical protein
MAYARSARVLFEVKRFDVGRLHPASVFCAGPRSMGLLHLILLLPLRLYSLDVAGRTVGVGRWSR